MKNKTILIVGQAGPQGKSYLTKRLRGDGYQVVEIAEVYYCDYKGFEFRKENLIDGGVSNGFINGFLVINFKNNFFKPDYNYVMSDEEYNNIIKKIEEGNDFTL